MIRTTPVEYGTKPYQWNIPSMYQCTWYAYYRALEAGYPAPCWWDRETKTGSYTNAKDWLKNYRDPWEVKDRDYTPRAGDIAVFDGTYGHVQFMETDTMYSEYSNGDPDSFRNGKFERKSNLLGFLHYPCEAVEPVERNVNVDQIKTTDDTLRIRSGASLKAEIVGYVQIGYYNVLSQKKADGYTWYQIAKDRWCANVSTVYLPAGGDDFVAKLKEYLDAEELEKQALRDAVEEYKDRMAEIHRLSGE